MAKRGQVVRRSPIRSKLPTKPKRAPADVDLKKENATLRRELSEALERQTATSEVLQVISSTPGDLEPVFQSLLENAVRICGAQFGMLNLYDGGQLDPVAFCNVPQAYAATHLHLPIRPHPKSGLGTVVRTRRTVHIEDLRTWPAYREGNPAVVALADLAGARTLVIVPMLKDAALVGTIGVYRQEVRPFTDKQVGLLADFAAQAAIAVENARVVKELCRRTDDLKESLQQQTATAEILKVINASKGDPAPVFDIILEKAHSLCDVAIGSLQLYNGDHMRAVAI